MTDYNARFEVLARLYYMRFGILAPGKDEAPATNRNSSSHENRDRWNKWFGSGQAWDDVLDRLVDFENEIIAEQLRK